jgi:hypothetical protein
MAAAAPAPEVAARCTAVFLWHTQARHDANEGCVLCQNGHQRAGEMTRRQRVCAHAAAAPRRTRSHPRRQCQAPPAQGGAPRSEATNVSSIINQSEAINQARRRTCSSRDTAWVCPLNAALQTRAGGGHTSVTRITPGCIPPVRVPVQRRVDSAARARDGHAASHAGRLGRPVLGLRIMQTITICVFALSPTQTTQCNHTYREIRYTEWSTQYYPQK